MNLPFYLFIKDDEDVDVVAARGLDLSVDRIIILGPYILRSAGVAVGGIITVIIQHKYYWQRSVMRVMEIVQLLLYSTTHSGGALVNLFK